MKKALFSFIAVLMFISLSGVLSAADEIFRNAKTGDSQKAEELRKTEEDFDKRIQVEGEKLGFYYRLKEIDVKYTPMRTIFRKGDDYVELQSYTFIPMSFAHGKPVGGRYKNVRLYYNGETLSKIETDVVNENFLRQTKSISKIVDPSPGDANVNDISISTSFNDGKPYTVKLEDIENTITNPLRIEFKREYYLKHLTQFERLFRYTWEYQKRFGTNNDKITIDTLKRSLEY